MLSLQMASLIRSRAPVRAVSLLSQRFASQRFASQRFARPAVRCFSDERHPVEVLSPGAKAGEIPDEIEQTAGKSHEEYVLEEQGRRRFNRGALTGPFGTQEVQPPL